MRSNEILRRTAHEIISTLMKREDSESLGLLAVHLDEAMRWVRQMKVPSYTKLLCHHEPKMSDKSKLCLRCYNRLAQTKHRLAKARS